MPFVGQSCILLSQVAFCWAKLPCAWLASTLLLTFVAAVGNEANASTAKIKWKKLAKRALTAAGGKLKVKKLQKQLLQQAGVPEPQQALALKHLMAQVISSKQFTVDGSSVTLAAL